MRAASPVSVHGGHDPAWRTVQALLPALATGVAGAWGLSMLEQPAWPALFPASALAAALAWRLRPGAFSLAWDGGRWRLDEREGDVQLMIDLDLWLLLRWREAASGRCRWLGLAAAEAGPHWSLLRAALYAPRPLPGAGLEAGRGGDV